ncbi:MAG: hypothetical protein K6D57_01605 [Paludibacteraceae bacterium]|nr:hypothetical protein [Paludibacteraceae bacterium]
MKKLFTLGVALLASFSLWAASETNPTAASSNTDIVGTAYTIPGTYIAGKGSTKVGAMPDKGIKFRLNQPAGVLENAIEFTVNEGYVINAIQLVGITNSDNKAATVGSIYVDGVAWNGTFNGALPAKNASEASDIQVSGIEAAQSVVFVFSDLGGASQGNICYTVTYEEAVQKEVDHVVETLTGAAVNGVALDETKMITLLNNGEFEDLAYYVEAPTVTFTVQTDTYYVGEETPSTKSKDIDVVAELAAGMWIAQYTIDEQTYTIRATKPETRTITFMDGETVLGTEVVAKGGTSTKHAEFETQPQTTFEGWFRNSNFTSQIDIQTYTINEDQPLYGKFTKAYAQSLNIEQLVLDQTTKADIGAILTEKGYVYANINGLDTINDLEDKVNRNYAYLGLKLKKTGAYVACNLKQGNVFNVKFGNVAADLTIGVNGVYNTLAKADATEYSYTASDGDAYVEIITTTDGTVVLQQLMINEEIANVTLPDPSAYLITVAEAANGTVTANWANKKYRTPVGETVTLTVTPAEGYKTGVVTVNGEELAAVEDVYSFTMPAQEVTVAATFVESIETGVDDVEADAKIATKRLIDGVLVIEKDGVLYNAQGGRLK